MPTASSSTTLKELSRMSPDGPTGSNETSPRNSRIAPMSTSKLERRKSAGSAKDSRREPSSCPIGIGPTRTATTNSRLDEGLRLKERGVGKIELRLLPQHP